MDVIDLAKYVYSLSLDSSGYSSGMNEAEKQAETMKTKLSGVSNFLKTSLVAGLAAAGTAITGTIVAGVHATADLDEQMSKFTASTGATVQETEKIRDLAQELFRTNTDSMEDIIATSEAMVKQMGLTTDEVEKYQQAYMDYAKTTGQANTDVIGAIDDIGDAWGLTADQSVKSLDMLKKSNEEYGTDIAAVQSALTGVAPAAKALGLSLEETNGYMNLFAASGLDAGQSITAFTYAAKQVESPEQFKQMVQDISAISDPTARAQKAVELFGSKAGIAMANVDASQLDDFIVTMDEAAGSVSKASGEFDNNLNVQIELMKKQFIGLAQELGERFMPVINDSLKWVTKNMPVIVGVIESAIDTIGKVIDPVIKIVRGVIQSFQDLDGQTTLSFGAMQGTISSIIETVQGILQGFVALFTAIWDKWGNDLVSFAQNHFNNIMAVIQNALDLIQGVVSFFTAFFTGDWEGCFEALQNIATSAFNLINSLFKAQIDLLKGVVKAGFTLLASIVEGLMNLLWQGIKSVWNNIVSWFADKINELTQWFGSLGETFTDIGSNILNWVFDGLKNTWKSISSWVSDKVDWLTDKLAFWNSSKNKMSSDSSSSRNSDIDGSHANGLSYVPFDGYTALLHKGERVLTARENAAYSSNLNTPIVIKMGDISVNGNPDATALAQLKKIAQDQVDAAKNSFVAAAKNEVFNTMHKGTVLGY